MARVEQDIDRLGAEADVAAARPGEAGAGGGVPARVVVVAAGAVVVAALVLAAIVSASRSAWELLGAGRGLVDEPYYPHWAFVLLLGTTLGQAAGWAGGSVLLHHGLVRTGLATGWAAARLAMSLVYVGLAGLPLAVYHVIFGGWLLGLPREGLEGWLAQHHPDAYWLLVTAHPVVDLSLLPLGIVFLGVLWAGGPPARGSLWRLVVLALALLLTSLAIALSLGIHSTLVHIRL
jgi:hypothetical protein